jgi:tetratricopeptide (TPR) repeat protein
VLFLEGNLEAAEDMALSTFDVANAEAPVLAGEAYSLMGQIAAARGNADAAKSAYRQAVFFLSAAGADRDAAQLWFELADLLQDVGNLDAAREAYRSAAATTGLRSRTSTRVGLPVTVPAGLAVS